MEERIGRRQFLSRVAEKVAGGIVTLGLLGTPIAVFTVLSNIESASLKEISKTSRYKIEVDELVRMAVPGSVGIIRSTYFTDNQPKQEVNEEKRQYILRDAIESYRYDKFKRFREVVIINPVNFSIVEQSPL